jgi:hypothetical protein
VPDSTEEAAAEPTLAIEIVFVDRISIDIVVIVGTATFDWVDGQDDAPRVWCRSCCLSLGPGGLDGLIVA